LAGGAPVDLPLCGNVYAEPFGHPSSVAGRPCTAAGHSYKPRHKTIGHDILDIDSGACAVPDSEYQLLDDVIDSAIAKYRQRMSVVQQPSDRDKALAASLATRDVLLAYDFALFIPVKTLADALWANNPVPGAGRYLFDCDTGSFIYLSVADALGLTAQLVDITLPSGSGHNYVEWAVAQGPHLEWDPNGQSECQTPANLPVYEGRAMNRDETIGYVYYLRALTRKASGQLRLALEDYHHAEQLRPNAPNAWNNAAWLISTHQELGQRLVLATEAIDAAQKAVRLNRSANYLDTLACAFAAAGKLSEAAVLEAEAVAAAPSNTDFQRRLNRFRGNEKSSTCFGES
jgi:tetratricopeptide (TPR) repeat protein